MYLKIGRYVALEQYLGIQKEGMKECESERVTIS